MARWISEKRLSASSASSTGLSACLRVCVSACLRVCVSACVCVVVFVYLHYVQVVAADHLVPQPITGEGEEVPLPSSLAPTKELC